MLDAHPGMTRRSLAMTLGLLPETVYRVIDGTRPGDWSLETLSRIEKKTGIPAWHILRNIQEGTTVRIDRPSSRK